MIVTGTYDLYLITLSILVAAFASYTALDIGGQRGGRPGTCASHVAGGGCDHNGTRNMVDALHRHARLHHAIPICDYFTGVTFAAKSWYDLKASLPKSA
jgi:hypothetical protein